MYVLCTIFISLNNDSNVSTINLLEYYNFHIIMLVKISNV